MKRISILLFTLFQVSVYATSLEKVPMEIVLEIFKLAADTEKNLDDLLRSKRVSKYWYKLITNQKMQKILKEQKLLLENIRKEADAKRTAMINAVNMSDKRYRLREK